MNKIKKITFLVILTALFVGLLMTVSQARIYTNDPKVKSGATVTITVSSQESLKGYKVSIKSNSGLTFKSASGGTYVEGDMVLYTSMTATKNVATYTFKAPEVTKETKYTVTFQAEGVIISGKEDEETSSEAIATVTVTPKVTSSGGGNGSSSDEKPKFTSVNQTVYCTEDDVNVRSSYSTSSSALGQLDKGDSVTRTGTATVNGRGWSRITYNGKTAYVVSQYLSTTKPVIEENNDEEEETTEEKSSNNLLKSLTVTPEGLNPIFDQNITEYELTIGSDIDKLEINAIAEDEKAKVVISGNEDLELGKNTITIKVTAEDKSVKTYEIIVTKESEEQLGLKELLIEGLPLNPEFSETTYEYTLDLDKEVSELNITATPSREEAEVEIVGNTKLQEGENIITVLVTDGEEVVTYQIKVKVTLPIVEETKDTSIIKGISNEQLYKYIAIGVIVLILIIVIIKLIRNRQQDDEEYEDDEFDYNDDEIANIETSQEQEVETKIEIPTLADEDLPKSLRKGKEVSEDEISEERKRKIDELTSTSTEYEEAGTRKKGKHF